MTFSDGIRAEVGKRARFRCCRCHEIGIDVHHIVPESEGGADTFDNAAPLCQNCHGRFGANPTKRKEITQMRDLWYEVAKEKWPTADDRAERLNDAVVNAETGTNLDSVVSELRAELDRLKAMLDNEPTPTTIREVATGMVTATRLGEGVYSNVNCRRCGMQIGMSIGATACPRCRAPFE